MTRDTSLAAPTAKAPRDARAPGARPPVRTVLLVEDDDLLRLLLAKTFEDAGHHVLAVDTSAAAADALAAYVPDLLVSDVELPDGSGLEVARLVRTRHGREVAVVLISGGDWRHAALHAGADAFMLKPFDLRALHETCDALLA